MVYLHSFICNKPVCDLSVLIYSGLNIIPSVLFWAVAAKHKGINEIFIYEHLATSCAVHISAGFVRNLGSEELLVAACKEGSTGTAVPVVSRLGR